MSADNWTVCPQCRKNALEAQTKAILEAGKSYGKVLPEKFIEMTKEANKPIEYKGTLREDYELGVNKEGVFSVSYAARCQECDYHFDFKENKQTLKQNF